MTQQITEYVSTLMFNKARTRAAFILKNRPAFLAGKVCPVGGRKEPNETPRQAAAREHGEETLVETHEEDWTHYARIEKADSVIDCFCMEDDRVEDSRTNTAEENFEEVYVLDILDVLTASATPCKPNEKRSYVLQDEQSVSPDIVMLIGLAMQSLRTGSFALIKN